MSFSFTYQASPEAPPFPFVVPGEIECTNERAFRTGGQFRLHPTQSIFAKPDAPIENDPRDWGPATIQSVPADVKTTFNKKNFTFSDRSIKARRTQTGDSQYELFNVQDREMECDVLDFLTHGLILTWDNGPVKPRYSPDLVALDVNGRIIVDEVKASRSYFIDPWYRALMDRVTLDLAAVNIKFREYDGSDIRYARRRYNVARAYSERHTAFTERQVEAVAELLASEAAGVPMGRIEDALNVHPRAARMVVHALLCHRKLAFNLNHRISRETLVTQARKPPRDLPDIRAIHIQVPRQPGLTTAKENTATRLH